VSKNRFNRHPATFSSGRTYFTMHEVTIYAHSAATRGGFLIILHSRLTEGENEHFQNIFENLFAGVECLNEKASKI